eukprot:768694-Hanusia_phi.AAC.6
MGGYYNYRGSIPSISTKTSTTREGGKFALCQNGWSRVELSEGKEHERQIAGDEEREEDRSSSGDRQIRTGKRSIHRTSIPLRFDRGNVPRKFGAALLPAGKTL